MIKEMEYPQQVPCPACGLYVEKSDSDIELKIGGKKLVITGMPTYECSCGILFVPHEAEELIDSVRRDKKLRLATDQNIAYDVLAKKGTRAIK